MESVPIVSIGIICELIADRPSIHYEEDFRRGLFRAFFKAHPELSWQLFLRREVFIPAIRPPPLFHRHCFPYRASPPEAVGALYSYEVRYAMPRIMLFALYSIRSQSTGE
jgi:hypothetical protein